MRGGRQREEAAQQMECSEQRQRSAVCKPASRAEQVISGAIMMVAMRSRLFSMTRVAITAGTAQA